MTLFALSSLMDEFGIPAGGQVRSCLLNLRNRIGFVYTVVFFFIYRLFLGEFGWPKTDSEG